MLAIRYPQLVSLLYLDAPVLNILSIAGYGDGEFRPAFWQELVSAYGFNKSTIVNFRESPIDYLNVLIENDIPVVLVYGDADVVGLPGIHIECKRVEKLNLYDAMSQAISDARADEIPAVFHRKNRCEWLVTMKLEDFMKIYPEWEVGKEENNGN
jgi:hypothetical protein